MPVKPYIDPTIILVSTRVDDAVIDRLDPELRSRGSVAGDSEQSQSRLLVYS